MAVLKLCVFLVFVVVVTAMHRRPSHPPPDVDEWYRVFEAFPRLVAISTSSYNTDFKCLSGSKTKFDATKRTSGYIWYLNPQRHEPRGTIAFDIEFGNSTHRMTYYVNNDRTRALHANVYYTDYENCLVSLIPIPDEDLCILWVKPSVAYRVPHSCFHQYERACDVRVPAFDKRRCPEV